MRTLMTYNIVLFHHCPKWSPSLSLGPLNSVNTAAKCQLHTFRFANIFICGFVITFSRDILYYYIYIIQSVYDAPLYIYYMHDVN